LAEPNLPERQTRQLERLFPRCLAEHRVRVGRVHREVRRLGNTRLANERLGQPLRVVYVVEAKAPFDAKPLKVRRPVAPFDANDPVVVDVVRNLTTDAAVGTHGVHGLVDLLEIRVTRRRERAGRARLHAFAACDAGRAAHRIVEVEHDLRMAAAEGVADHVVHLLLATRPHAARALDAGIEVDRHRRVREVRSRLTARREAWLFDTKLTLPVGKLRIQFVDALRHVGCEQFEHHLLRMQRAGARRRHLHAGRWRTAA